MRIAHCCTGLGYQLSLSLSLSLCLTHHIDGRMYSVNAVIQLLMLLLNTASFLSRLTADADAAATELPT